MVGFTITPIRSSTVEGGSVQFTISITNPNYAAVGSYVIYWRTNPTAQNAASGSDYGAVTTLQSLTFSSTSAQSYTITIQTTADSTIEGAEFFAVDLYDFQRNYLGVEKVFTIVDLAPDLQIDSLTPTGASVAAGTGVSLGAVIHNYGNATAAASSTRFYLSTNSTLDASDTLLTTLSTASLAAGATTSIGQSVPLSSSLAPGQYYLIVAADYNDQVAESNNANNSFATPITITAPALADLQIDSLTPVGASVAAGTGVSLGAVIHNYGNATAAASSTRFYLSTNSTLDANDTLLTTLSTASLAAGATTSIGQSVALSGSLAPGQYYLIVAADYNDQIAESNNANNSFATPITITAPAALADLQIDSLTPTGASVAAGTGVSLGAVIHNYGNATAGASSTRFYLSTNSTLDANDTLLTTLSTASLAAGATTSIGQSVALSGSLAPGQYYLIVAADYNDQIAESNNANNSFATPITITAPALADLQIDSLTPTGANVVAGTGISLGATVHNYGNATAGASSTRFYLSTNSTLDANDTLLTTLSTASLAAGATTSIGQSVALSSSLAPGQYYLIVAADYNDQIAESNNANNSFATPITVSAPSSSDDFGSTIASAGVVAIGGQTTGVIETPSDSDWFAVTLTAGATYQFDVIGAHGGGGSLADPFMRLRDSLGATLRSNDNGVTTGPDSQIQFVAPSTGTYFISVGGDLATGGSYTLRATLVAAASTDVPYVLPAGTRIPILPGGVVTQGFAADLTWGSLGTAPAGHSGDPLTHPGIDISAPLNTPLLAFADGDVALVDYSPSLGWYLVIHHPADATHPGNETVAGGHDFYSLYLHMNEAPRDENGHILSQGDVVLTGHQVAQVGNSGESTGPHVHFEIRLFEGLFNPIEEWWRTSDHTPNIYVFGDLSETGLYDSGVGYLNPARLFVAFPNGVLENVAGGGDITRPVAELAPGQSFAGSSGTDTFTLLCAWDVSNDITISAGGGGEVLIGTQGSTSPVSLTQFEELVLQGGSLNDTVLIGSLIGTSIAQNTLTLYGYEGADRFDATSNDRHVVLDGGAGDDFLMGGSAADTIVGGAGNDTLQGDPSLAVGTPSLITLQPGPEGQDEWITSFYSYGDNYGVDNQQLRIGGWADNYYSLLRFDLSGVSLVAPVASATLRLYVVDFNGGSSTGLSVDELHTAWDENYGWYDHSLSYSNVTTASAPGIGWFEIDVTQAVLNWLADPATNFGLQLRPLLTNNNFLTIVSSDATGDQIALRPQLVIASTTGAGSADFLDGGAGVDTAMYASASTADSWHRNPDGTWTVITNLEGTDTLSSIEFLHFTDRDVFLDRAGTNFSGDGASDILLRRTDGVTAIWSMNGATVIGAGVTQWQAGSEWQIQGVGDFNSDGRDDFLLRRLADGVTAIWSMNGANVIAADVTLWQAGNEWQIQAVGDFNCDGNDDFLWRRTSDGVTAIWQMNGTNVVAADVTLWQAGNEWQIQGVGDFNGDGRDDFLWRRTSDGVTAIWSMNGTNVVAADVTSQTAGNEWSFTGIGDFNGDGRDDLLLRRSDGATAIWLMNGTSITSAGLTSQQAGADWNVAAIGDYNGDGRDDILMRHDSGVMAVWTMNGFVVSAEITTQTAGPEWTPI